MDWANVEMAGKFEGWFGRKAEMFPGFLSR